MPRDRLKNRDRKAGRLANKTGWQAVKADLNKLREYEDPQHRLVEKQAGRWSKDR